MYIPSETPPYGFEYVIKFGKYSGKTIGEVLNISPEYLDWCIHSMENFIVTQDVVDAIDKALPFVKYENDYQRDEYDYPYPFD